MMFDRQTSGEVPEHRDFIYNRLKPFCEKELGIPFTVLRAGKTYEDVFHHIIVRGPHQGEKRGFVWPGMCAVNRDCKVPPIRKYNASLSPETVSYVGIAADEPVRLARLAGTNKVSLLDKYGLTEAEAYHRKKIDKDKRGAWYAFYECSSSVNRRYDPVPHTTPGKTRWKPMSLPRSRSRSRPHWIMTGCWISSEAAKVRKTSEIAECPDYQPEPQAERLVQETHPAL